MTPRGYFITGTDTNAGKTRVTAALCHAFVRQGLKVAAMKPIASGGNDDALQLQAAMNLKAAYSDINPYVFEPAIAPHLAAAEANTRIDFAVLDRAFERLKIRSEIILVEGAGGWRVPIDAEYEFADLPARWKLDVILVVGLKLGCLNHALLSAESIERRGVSLAGWVGNRIDPEFQRAGENIETLRAKLRAPCLGILPFAPDESAAAAAAHLSLGALTSSSPCCPPESGPRTP